MYTNLPSFPRSSRQPSAGAVSARRTGAADISRKDQNSRWAPAYPNRAGRGRPRRKYQQDNRFALEMSNWLDLAAVNGQAEGSLNHSLFSRFELVFWNFTIQLLSNPRLTQSFLGRSLRMLRNSEATLLGILLGVSGVIGLVSGYLFYFMMR